MEITYIYGNYLHVWKFACRPSTVAPLRSQSTKIVGIFRNWKSSHKRKSCLVKYFTINTSLFFAKKSFSDSFFYNNVVVLLLISPNMKNEFEIAYNTTATLEKSGIHRLCGLW